MFLFVSVNRQMLLKLLFSLTSANMGTLTLSNLESWKVSEWNLSDTGLINAKLRVGICLTFFLRAKKASALKIKFLGKLKSVREYNVAE